MLRTALVAAVALLDATPAQACSGDFACLSGRIVTDVPANAPGLGGLFGTYQQDQPDAGPVVFGTDGGLVAYQSLATDRQTVKGPSSSSRTWRWPPANGTCSAVGARSARTTSCSR